MEAFSERSLPSHPGCLDVREPSGFSLFRGCSFLFLCEKPSLFSLFLPVLPLPLPNRSVCPGLCVCSCTAGEGFSRGTEIRSAVEGFFRGLEIRSEGVGLLRGSVIRLTLSESVFLSISR